MIIDSSKEQNMGYFKGKVAEAGCHLRQMEPEYLRQMAAEVGICQLKIGSGKNMIKMKSTKVIWDDFWSWKHTYAPTRL